MHRGYFALWRKFQEHTFWKEKRVFSKAEAWLDILWEAQHNKIPQQVTLGKDNMTCLICHYGESLKSLRTWAKRWGWTKDRVQRFLKLLKNMSQIETVSETVTTRIIVLNYKQYDPRRDSNETATRQQRDSNETATRQDKKDKKDKKVKKDIVLPEWLPEKIWDEFKKHRIKIRKPLSEYAEKLNIEKLEKLKANGNDPIKVVQKTISSGWQGFFPLDGKPQINYENMQ